MMKVNKKTILNGVTTTTVSDPICVRYAKRVTFSFKRTSHVSGDVVFKIQASINGKDGDYTPTVPLIKNQSNLPTQDIAREISVSLNSNSKVFAALDLEHFCYDYIQVSAVESGSGTNTVKAIIVE